MRKRSGIHNSFTDLYQEFRNEILQQQQQAEIVRPNLGHDRLAGDTPRHPMLDRPKPFSPTERNSKSRRDFIEEYIM